MTVGTAGASTSALCQPIPIIIRFFTVAVIVPSISVELNLQPDRVTNKAAGSISIVAGAAVLAVLSIIVICVVVTTPGTTPLTALHPPPYPLSSP
jgi:hypothetical protein